MLAEQTDTQTCKISCGLTLDGGQKWWLSVEGVSVCEWCGVIWVSQFYRANGAHTAESRVSACLSESGVEAEVELGAFATGQPHLPGSGRFGAGSDGVLSFCPSLSPACVCG